MAQSDDRGLKRPMTRRAFVRGSAVSIGVVAAGSALTFRPVRAAAASAAAAALPPYVGAGSNAPVRPFPLYQVALGNGLFKEKRERILNFARAYDQRRYLVLFNNVAGRPNPPGVTVPGGWEDGGLLSGHWTGHFMSMLAVNGRASGSHRGRPIGSHLSTGEVAGTGLRSSSARSHPRGG